MEFYEFVDAVTTQEALRENLTLENLPVFCEEIEAVDEVEELGRAIYFRHWGRFHIRCETVMGGMRFSVPDCPNALAWTVTTGYPPYPEKIVLHATINRTEHDPEFIAGVKKLVVALKHGIMSCFVKETAKESLRSFQIVDLRPKDL